MSKHPHIEVITAWYNGESIEYMPPSGKGPWRAIEDHKDCPAENIPVFDPRQHYRIKPKTYTLVLEKPEMATLAVMIGDYVKVRGHDSDLTTFCQKVAAAEYVA